MPQNIDDAREMTKLLTDQLIDDSFAVQLSLGPIDIFKYLTWKTNYVVQHFWIPKDVNAYFIGTPIEFIVYNSF